MNETNIKKTETPAGRVATPAKLQSGPTPPIGPRPQVRNKVVGAKASEMSKEAVAAMFVKLKNNYQVKKGNKVNIMLAGDSGTGKTHILKTMPGPIFIDSFDPGGLTTLTEEIESGFVIPSVHWEDETPKKPFAFKEWDNHITKLIDNDFFEHVGTYVLDSLTTWGDALMGYILQLDMRPNTNPQIQDYGLQQTLARTAIKALAGLPCNVVITAHLDTMKDEVSGAIMTSIMIPGKASVKLPLEFSELYVLESKDVRSGTDVTIQRTLLTQKTGRYRAKTRIGRNGLFKLREPADLGALMRKAGYPTENKPLMPGT